MPPLLGVYVFTDRLAFAAADWCFRLHGWPLCRRCWASTSSPTGRLVRRRLVLPPARLAFNAAVVGRLRHHRLACLRRRRLVFPPAWLAFMPPLLGVYVFTDRLAFAAADWCFRLHGWPLCRRCWASTSSPTGRLVRRRLVLPPARLAYYAAVVGRLRLQRPAASSAADWCLCLHGWPIMPPLLGVYVFTDRLAFAAADWCFRLHGWPLMPPLLGVYVFTDRLAFAAADWCFRLHGWPLCRRYWASTSSPTGRLVRRRLVFPPARLAFMPPLLGVYVFTDRLAFAAADWCFRLHGWPLCRRCWASTSSPTGRRICRRLVFPPARLAYYAAVVGRLRLHRPACLRRRRLVFPPARLAFMPPLLGVYVFTDRLAFAAADWCFRLHGWPLCRRCWASTSSPTGRLVRRRLVLPPARLTYYAVVVGRLRLHRPAASTAADWCFRLHGWPIMLPLLGVYVFTDRPPHPPLTGVTACTAGLL
uniref:cysteine dioxygenase n=1 Tax=Oryza sativa subsp. japonica TaxID=39947 RepID=Q6UUQ8_ORYSJ|nr:hypothetical protein OSJNBa0079I01.28 [Oryza sativa Japonica Group]